MGKTILFIMFVALAALSFAIRLGTFVPKKEKEAERVLFWREQAELPLFLAVYPLFPALCVLWSALGVSGVLSPIIKLIAVLPLALVLPYLITRRKQLRSQLSERVASNVLSPMRIAIWLYGITVIGRSTKQWSRFGPRRSAHDAGPTRTNMTSAAVREVSPRRTSGQFCGHTCSG